MDDAVYQNCELSEQDIEQLQKIELGMPILADISRADLLLFCRTRAGDALVATQAKPHSVSPVYSGFLVGQRFTSSQRPSVLRALLRGWFVRGEVTPIPRGAPVVQEIHPISGQRSNGKPIAVLSIETNLIEWERHLRRKKPFQIALRQLQYMLLNGWLDGGEGLSSFGEHDGIVVVDAQKRVIYISGVATNLYRKLGYMGELVGERIANLETDDETLIARVLNDRYCLEEETQEQQRIWKKKAIPLLSDGSGEASLWGKLTWFHTDRPRVVGAMMTVHDLTDERLREREMNIKSTMIQEIHHRVKNNLQTIAALLRLQARRVGSEESKQILQESINRILSVAVVHEFLSRPEANSINIRDVSQRIISQVQQGLLDPDKSIRIEFNGPSIYLTPQQTTSCALLVNELIQNAVEHGYESKTSGVISVNLADRGDSVMIEVADDGGGLPSGFDLGHDVSLGLRIVQSLATDDLRGQFELKNSGNGTSAIVIFPKTPIGGM